MFLLCTVKLICYVRVNKSKFYRFFFAIVPLKLFEFNLAYMLNFMSLTLVYLRTKVLHGCCKPVFINLRQYTNLTLPVIEFPFHKELSSEKI